MLLRRFFEDNRSIVTTKTKCVAQCYVYHTLLSLIEGEVQTAIECRVVGKVIDGWRHNIVYGSQYTCNSFYGTSRTQKKAGQRLGRTDIDVESMIAKYALYSRDFAYISQRRRGTMHIDVINDFRLHS